MSSPRSKDFRLYDRCATERLKDARKLLENDRATGAVYLAGYAVECILKALLLSAVPERRHDQVVETFRGRRGHDYEWLRNECIEQGGIHFSPKVNHGLFLVDAWSTDLRYSPGTEDTDGAREFLNATAMIVEWARKQF